MAVLIFARFVLIISLRLFKSSGHMALSDVMLTQMRRHYVASKSVRHHFAPLPTGYVCDPTVMYETLQVRIFIDLIILLVYFSAFSVWQTWEFRFHGKKRCQSYPRTNLARSGEC